VGFFLAFWIYAPVNAECAHVRIRRNENSYNLAGLVSQNLIATLATDQAGECICVCLTQV